MPQGTGPVNCVQSEVVSPLFCSAVSVSVVFRRQAVAQFDERAGVRLLAGVRVDQAALIQVFLKRQRVVAAALRRQRRDPEVADRPRRADRPVVLIERSVGGGETILPRLRRLQRGEIHAAAERPGARAETRARSGEEVGVDPAQVRGRTRRGERDAVERHRGLRLVVTVQRDRLRRIRIVRTGRDVDAGQRVERVGERIGDAPHRAVLIDVVSRNGHARLHAPDDRHAARARIGRGSGGGSRSTPSATLTSTSLLPSSSNAAEVVVW